MRLTGGVFHRKVDAAIVKEVKVTYSDMPVKGALVLDLGANIGAAAKLFLDKGAAKVIAVEPDPSNMVLARRNLARRSATLIWAAAGPTTGRTTIYAARKPFLTSTIEDTGRIAVKVPQVTLGGLLSRYPASVVKCDIEFGEYDLPELTCLPDFVKVLALEVHVRYDLVFSRKTQTDGELREHRQRAADLMASIESQGFRLLKRREKKAKDRPIQDVTGLDPYSKSIDAIWIR